MDKLDLRDLEDVLGIYSPWSIKSARPSDQGRVFDVYLEPADRTRLFGLLSTSNKSAEPTQPGSWHYTSLGKYRVMVHAQLPSAGDQGPALNYSTLTQPCFLGSLSRKYSNHLRQQVAMAQVRGLTTSLIAELLDIDATVIETIQQDLGNAPSQVQFLACIPTELDPVWEKILRSEITLTTQVLPFRLLLNKLQLAASQTKRTADLVNHAVELRKFFIANASILGNEIEQISGGSTQSRTNQPQGLTSIKKLILPGLGNPVWQELLTGKMQLNSSSIALNLLISKQKAAFAQAGQPSEKLAIVELIRGYFLKNYRMLKPELLLINRACAIREKTRYRLPEPDHAIWQQILQDDSFIPSNHIAYKLLLARLRAQVRTASGPAARIDAARRIREFIKQNHKSMKQELVYLFKQANAA